MTVYVLDSTPLQALVDQLRAAGLSADLDPAELSLPGCWVALDQLATATLAGQLRLSCTVYLIAPDTDPRRALDALGPMYDTVTDVLTPDGPVVTQGVVMPADPTPLPALAVPVYLYTGE